MWLNDITLSGFRGVFGPVPVPLPLPMMSFLPFEVTATAVGYQPVGMNPRTRLRFRSEVSITQTLLLSAFAT
jgi:hypothetical protein